MAKQFVKTNTKTKGHYNVKIQAAIISAPYGALFFCLEMLCWKDS